MEGLKAQDEILANTVKQTPLGHSSFFKTDILDHIKDAITLTGNGIGHPR